MLDSALSQLPLLHEQSSSNFSSHWKQNISYPHWLSANPIPPLHLPCPHQHHALPFMRGTRPHLGIRAVFQLPLMHASSLHRLPTPFSIHNKYPSFSPTSNNTHQHTTAPHTSINITEVCANLSCHSRRPIWSSVALLDAKPSIQLSIKLLFKLRDQHILLFLTYINITFLYNSNINSLQNRLTRTINTLLPQTLIHLSRQEKAVQRTTRITLASRIR